MCVPKPEFQLQLLGKPAMGNKPGKISTNLGGLYAVALLALTESLGILKTRPVV
jgi:hypothetical protein